jgi:hypothetical protein
MAHPSFRVLLQQRMLEARFVTRQTDSIVICRISGSNFVCSVARMGVKRNAYRLLVGKPEGRRPLGRRRRRWLGNIRMDLVEVLWHHVDWIGLARDRDRWRALVNSVSNLRVVGGKARGKEAIRKTKT